MIDSAAVTFTVHGHELVSGSDRQAFEFVRTAEPDENLKRVAGVSADWADADLRQLRGRLRVTLRADGVSDTLQATVSPGFLGGDSLVFRTGEDHALHTFAFDSTAGAADLDPAILSALRTPGAAVEVSLSPVDAHLQPDQPGALFVAGLPIGNHDDLAPRTRHVLEGVDVVLAEDTRRFAQLAAAVGLRTGPVTSHHLGNEGDTTAALVARLLDGERVALVTDAGTPIVSDPGFELVRAARQAGIEVRPIPGPSAPIVALSASGIPASSFTFIGFLPRKSAARQALLATMAGAPGALVMFEAPHRLVASLDDIAAVLPGRDMVVACEMTKMYEEFISGRTDLGSGLLGGAEPRGEYTLVISPPAKAGPDDGADSAVLELAEAVSEFVPSRALADAIASATGMARKAAYQRVLDFRRADEQSS